jgi:hypothetical protein
VARRWVRASLRGQYWARFRSEPARDYNGGNFNRPQLVSGRRMDTHVRFLCSLPFRSCWCWACSSSSTSWGTTWVARRNGIVVEEFGLGYPPRAAKLFRYDGTDFTLNWLPLGGFARMKGEDAGDMSPGSFNAAGRGARAATLIAGPLMNFILAVIFFAAAAMLGTPAAAGSPLFSTISPAATALGLAAGDVLLTADGAPMQVPIVADASLTIPVEAAPGSAHQLTIIRDGAVMTLPGADANAVKEALTSSTVAPVLTTQVEGVAEGQPGAACWSGAGRHCLRRRWRSRHAGGPAEHIGGRAPRRAAHDDRAARRRPGGDHQPRRAPNRRQDKARWA